VTTVDALTAEYGVPHVIKVDVEGAEVQTLLGARETLGRRDRPTWVLELHSEALAREARAILADAGYHFHTLAGGVIGEDEPLGYHAVALPPERSADAVLQSRPAPLQ
jgi:hypothetical protein